MERAVPTVQHPLGVAFHDGRLFVADTYNNKIKELDPARRTSKSFLGERVRPKQGEGTFNEPGGLSFAGDKMYVADTNSHRIRVVDMKTKAVTTLNIKGLNKLGG